MADPIGLYRVSLTLKNKLMGSPQLHLDLLVNGPTAQVQGAGRITQAIAPPYGSLNVPQVTGGIYHTGFPVDQLLVHLTGKYIYPFPPTQPGQAELPISVAMVLGHDWNGDGSFTYSNHQVNDCTVTPEEVEELSE